MVLFLFLFLLLINIISSSMLFGDGGPVSSRSEADAKSLQTLSRSALESLLAHPETALPLWLCLPGLSAPVPVTITARLESDSLSAHFYLPPEAESGLIPPLQNSPLEPFQAFSATGRVFYQRGFCRSGIIRNESTGANIAFTHVPFRINGKDNEAFAGDLGLLTLEASTTAFLQEPQRVLATPFLPSTLRKTQTSRCPLTDPRLPANDARKEQGEVFVPPPGFSERHLFPFMRTRVGTPQRFDEATFAVPIGAFVLPPVHKLSANKHLPETEKKLQADIRNLTTLLAPGSSLLSQRERVRRRLVPDTVKLNWSRIDDTDLGTGQNQFVFLTLGAGINYFDGPWRSGTSAVPGPRVIIDPLVVNLADIQIYPSYSIDPSEKGEGRLHAINRFQIEETGGQWQLRRNAVSMPIKRRQLVINQLAEDLCRYGLLNTDPTLECGFSFLGKPFRGNPVNNEIRLRDGLSLREWAIAVIVPPGTGEQIRRRLAEIGYDDSSPPNGIPLSEFLIEAPSATDTGFRQAYLEFLLRHTQSPLHPIIHRLRPGSQGRTRPGYQTALQAIDRILKREGFSFLATPRSRKAATCWTEWREAWSKYLEAIFQGRGRTEILHRKNQADQLRPTSFVKGPMP
jgi:hypothetical protein